MAYFELDSVLFRGELKGATGVAQFRLTSKAINAVDTVNIGNDQVTYNKYINFNIGWVGSGAVIQTLNLNVPDATAWVEVTAYASRASTVRIDGSNQINRNRRSPNTKLLPFVALVKLNRGSHTVQLISGSAGSTEGYIIARYIRETGR